MNPQSTPPPNPLPVINELMLSIQEQQDTIEWMMVLVPIVAFGAVFGGFLLGWILREWWEVKRRRIEAPAIAQRHP